MDVVGRYIAIIIAIILVILFPLKYIASFETDNIYCMVYTYTWEFTNKAMRQGSITIDMYDELVKTLDMTGELYNITIEVAHPIRGITDIDELVLLYDITFTDEIIQAVHEDGFYNMNKRDLLTVTVKSTNKSIREKLESMFFNKQDKKERLYTFGGEVKMDGGS